MTLLDAGLRGLRCFLMVGCGQSKSRKDSPRGLLHHRLHGERAGLLVQRKKPLVILFVARLRHEGFEKDLSSAHGDRLFLPLARKRLLVVILDVNYPLGDSPEDAILCDNGGGHLVRV